MALVYFYAKPGITNWKPGQVDKTPAPIVVFAGIKCSDTTYVVHVAVDVDKDGKDLTDEEIGKPHYIGSKTRLGMGSNTASNRCINGGIVRRLEGPKVAADLGLKPNDEVKLKMLVMEHSGALEDDNTLGSHRVVPKEEYSKLPGFTPLSSGVTLLPGLLLIR